METRRFEPMSVSRILDETFSIYRGNFVALITIVALIEVPMALIQGLAQSSVARSNTPDTPAAVLQLGGYAITAVVAMLGQTLASGALTQSVSGFYLGQPISLGQAYQAVWPKVLTLFCAALLVALVVGVGILLLVVPGVIFSLWFALTTPTIVVEDLKVKGGMSRSMALAKGNLGKIFSVMFLVFVISMVIAIPFSLAGLALHNTLLATSPTAAVVSTHLARVAASVLAMPIGALAIILLYYDLRIRKEGFDLQMLVQSMDAKPAAYAP
jgi:hypothetical protein